MILIGPKACPSNGDVACDNRERKMMKRTHILPLSFLALTLSGCIALRPSQAPGTAPISDNAAVVSLADSAQNDTQAGNFGAATASLERALRIEPHNPGLWQELARVRLAEGRYQQAEALAQRSNSWAGDNKAMRAENWRIIGQSRVNRGDSSGADDAFKRADRLLK